MCTEEERERENGKGLHDNNVIMVCVHKFAQQTSRSAAEHGVLADIIIIITKCMLYIYYIYTNVDDYNLSMGSNNEARP